MLPLTDVAAWLGQAEAEVKLRELTSTRLLETTWKERHRCDLASWGSMQDNYPNSYRSLLIASNSK